MAKGALPKGFEDKKEDTVDISTGAVLPKGVSDKDIQFKKILEGKKKEQKKEPKKTQYIEELWWEKHYREILQKKKGKEVTKALKELENDWTGKYSKLNDEELKKFFKKRKLYVKTDADKKFLKVFREELTKHLRGAIKAAKRRKISETKGEGKDDEGEWAGWNDFLGTEPGLNKSKVEKIRVDNVLKKLRTNWLFYKRWTDGLIRTWFEAEGCFREKDPYKRSYFTNFFDLRKTPEGRKALIYWAKTQRFDKVYGGMALTEGGIVVNPEGQKIETATLISQSKQKIKLIEEDDIDARKVLKEIRKVDYDDTDPKTFDLHVAFTVQLLWKAAFGKETNSKKKITNSEVEKIIKEKNNGNRFHDTVKKTFLDEYGKVKNVKIPDGCTLKLKPTLMQIFNAWVMTQIDGFFNMSRTGVGKTLAAILATRVCNSKYTLVICSNSIVEQWKNQIQEFYPNSIISMGKIPHAHIKGAANYHIINYDKFSIKDVNTTISRIKKMPIDFLILDETQNIKIRHEEKTSQRRLSVDNLLIKLAKKEDLKVLCLSATPVINNIKEGKSMLELIAHSDKVVLKALKNIGEQSTVRNAAKLHTLFLPYCIRFMENLNIEVIGKDRKIEVTSYLPEGATLKDVEKMSWLNFEQIALEGKLDEIISRVKGKTLIYCEFVTGIVSKLQQRLEEKGFIVSIYTGSDKSGKEPFLRKDTDVLICSSALSEGFDGLQKISGNVIFASLPWTYAKFEQVIGRLIRRGRKKSKGAKKARVTIHLILSKIMQRGGEKDFEYDLKVKWNRLEFKNQTARCVTDGDNPDKIKLPRTPAIRKSICELMVEKQESLIPTRSQARAMKVPIEKKRKKKKDEKEK